MSDASRCAHCDRPLLADAFFCGTCGAPAANSVYCVGCEALVPAEAFFCHRCGTKVRDGTSPDLPAAAEVVQSAVLALAVPGKGVAIELDLGPGFEDEQLEATMRSLPGFEVAGDPGGPRVARVTFPTSAVEQLISFAEEVERRSARRVYRDGQLQDWAEFFAFVSCYRTREHSQNVEDYCFFDDTNSPNLWGCFQLRMALDASYEASDWLSLGHFERDGAFVFDKKRIIALLDQRSMPLRLCPALDVRRISAALKAMPAKANPQDSPDWKYLEDLAGEDPNAVTVHKRDGDKKLKVRIRGVAPASEEAAVRIATAIRAETAARTPIPE